MPQRPDCSLRCLRISALSPLLAWVLASIYNLPFFMCCFLWSCFPRHLSTLIPFLFSKAQLKCGCCNRVLWTVEGFWKISGPIIKDSEKDAVIAKVIPGCPFLAVLALSTRTSRGRAPWLSSTKQLANNSVGVSRRN